MDEIPQENTQNTQNDAVDGSSRYEKAVAVVAVCLVIVFMYQFLHVLYSDKPMTGVVNEAEHSQSTDTSDKTQEKKPGIPVPPDTFGEFSREGVLDLGPATLSGNVVKITPAEGYIRVSVPGDKVYSVGVTENTRIMSGDKEIELASIESLTEATIQGKELGDNAPYDYLAETITVPDTEALTEEERAARFLEEIENMNITF